MSFCSYFQVSSKQKLKRFRHFVNSEQLDTHIVRIEERGQQRPVTDEERSLIATEVDS